ncbi:MAG: hypothetical protein EBS38_01840 [Actinobacteria bacterium]|nr:hypothetical protein [Actinomycetota bacterium]
MVRIFDADNNLVTTGAQSTQTVELIASSGSLGGSTAISASGGIATFSGVSLTGTAGSITLTGRVYQPQTLSANQVIELGFGNATKLTLETQAAGAASGIALTTQPVLRLRDSADNIVTGVAHNVVASIDPAASLSGATVAVNTSTGTATFQALSISGTVGSYTLSYSIEGASSSAVASVSQAIELTHGVAVALKMVSQPNSGIAGTTLSPMVIEMVDARGNRVTTGEASSRSVTITAVNFGLLRGTISASLSSGVVTFDNVSVTEAGSNIRFTIVAANLGTFLYSSNMNITAGAPTRLTVALGQPVNKKAGEAQAANLTVRLEDNFGNIGTASSTYSLTVQIVSSSDTSVVERTANALTISPGGTIADALKNNLFVNKVGSWRIKVSSAGLQPAITNAFSISNAAASKLVVIQDVPASARSGLTFSPAVKLQVQDQFNNPVLDSVTTISATVVSGTSISVAGSRSANVLGDSFIELPNLAVEGLAGTKKLRFSMVSNSANANVAFADSADFSLTFGVATRLSASATAVTVSNRTNFPSVTISVLDSAGNIVTDNQAQIIASASGLAATGTQNRFAASGQVVFDDLIFSGSVGNYSLGFSAASLTSATVSVTINHGSAYRVELKIQQSSRNNKTLNATGVYIYDRDDNLVTTGAQSTQTVVIEAAGAVLSGTSAISASAGIATLTWY